MRAPGTPHDGTGSELHAGDLDEVGPEVLGSARAFSPADERAGPAGPALGS